ncbi:Tim44/TimA family putative adaptor protein [Minwuia thermotolerans]|uniref:Tim44-like domain-containing protein n=1 Tax=Minwuia thermotolerans TaxID=2056226 RepID=A0A2M9FWD2_9PROT|nr:Tim44/TimA family putative adaptor protein [Minwuia thermotolerans]PJK27753.1 hypothetical protein CVT23_19905 [Minwuia thermotolerans]
MGSDFPFFEVVIFGMIAAFFFLRLKNTLGRRTGHEQEEPRSHVGRRGEEPAKNGRQDDNVIRLPGQDAPRDTDFDIEPDHDATPLDRALNEIGRASGGGFDRASFVEGAKAAYELIVTSYAKGDKQALKPLLAGKVYKNFTDAIDRRKAEGQTQETELVGFDSVEIVDARVVDRKAEVTVRFVSEMISVTRDKDGEIVAGDAEDISVVTDIWTFAKDARSRDPNWELISTRSAH